MAEALFKLQRGMRNKMKRGDSLIHGSDVFKKVEQFLRRHPKHDFGEFKRIYVDYGNPYDNQKRMKGMCWWVEHSWSKVSNACSFIHTGAVH
tara:strand:+ start:167 stop:442 length:276 start_codon:yes stop_codon:yes gene_type:complete